MASVPKVKERPAQPGRTYSSIPVAIPVPHCFEVLVRSRNRISGRSTPVGGPRDRCCGAWGGRPRRSRCRRQILVLLSVFLGAVPPPWAGAFGHGVTAAAHLFGHVASGRGAMCPDDIDGSGQPLLLGSQRGGRVRELWRVRVRRVRHGAGADPSDT